MSSVCKYGDPFCPCQDGDMCHYEGPDPMPVALKASWEVRAGIIPGKPMIEYGKKWHYTSQDHEIDEKGDGSGYGYHAIFSKMRAEAMDYYIQMSMPQYNNWAELTFIWY